jgi:phosphosulfolactate phosphohydrolase-like enzyme
MGSVVIDSLPRSGTRYRDQCAIVVVDVIRFTTTATTALEMGRDVYPVKTTDDALELGETLDDPIFAGERVAMCRLDFS